MSCTFNASVEVGAQLNCSCATVLPLSLEDVCALTAEYISQVKWNEILLSEGLLNLNKTRIRSYLGRYSKGILFQPQKHPGWTIVLSEAGGALASLYHDKVTWRKRDGTWSFELEFPQTSVENENYYIAMHYKKCYPHPETQRIITDQRHVRVMREDSGKLKFFQQGESLPFEDVEQYQAKKLTDRMTSNYLLECAKRLGVDLLEEIKHLDPEKCYSFAELEPKLAQCVAL